MVVAVQLFFYIICNNVHTLLEIIAKLVRSQRRGGEKNTHRIIRKTTEEQKERKKERKEPNQNDAHADSNVTSTWVFQGVSVAVTAMD